MAGVSVITAGAAERLEDPGRDAAVLVVGRAERGVDGGREDEPEPEAAQR